MKNFVFYMTICYPDRAKFFEIMELLEKEGVGYVEIGLPVSNPFLDGDVIRQSHIDTLEKGITQDDIVDILKEMRQRFTFKIVLMTYEEGVKNYRLQEISRDLYDGYICVDQTYPADLLKNQINILNHTMDHGEMTNALSNNKLFAYVVSGTGKTGTFQQLPTDYTKVIQKIKKISKVPAFVGFGIKNAFDVCEVLKHGADGAIIGTEFIRQFQNGGLHALKSYMEEFKHIEIFSHVK